MKRGTYAAGAMVASLAAGPAFLASLLLAQWAASTPTTYAVIGDIGFVGGAIAAVSIATIFGFVLSVVPNIVGAWFMHGLGIGNFAARLPIAWAIVGAGAAGLPFVFIPDLTTEFMPLGTAFAFTGASCALVANRFSTWT